MKKIHKLTEEWKQTLTPEQYHILREKGTETPGSGEYYHLTEDGAYVCAGCGLKLFSSNTKYDSGSGLPSFYAPMDETHIEEKTDNSLGRQRTEILCAQCDAHLGHVFNDGANPTGLRYCVNSVSLQFKPEDEK